jgi:hypothetical protein
LNNKFIAHQSKGGLSDPLSSTVPLGVNIIKTYYTS